MKRVALQCLVWMCCVVWCGTAFAGSSDTTSPTAQARVVIPASIVPTLMGPDRASDWSWSKGAELDDDEATACMEMSGGKLQYVKVVLLALAWGSLVVANGFMLSLAVPSSADFLIGGASVLVGAMIAIYAGFRLKHSQNRAWTTTVLILSLVLVGLGAATLIKAGVQAAQASARQPLMASSGTQSMGLRFSF